MENEKVKNEFVEILDNALEAGKLVLEELRKENKMKAGPMWVKCADQLPGYKKSVKWRVSGSDVARHATLEALLRDRNFDFKSWEWLDESPSDLQAKCERAAVEFAEWVANNYSWEYDTVSDEYQWLEANNFYTTAELYTIFKQPKQGK